MDRRRFLLTSLAGALVAPFGAEGQQAAKVYRLGYLSDGKPVPPSSTPMTAFEETLGELGYVEGKNLMVDRRYAAFNYDRLPELPSKLQDLGFRTACGLDCEGGRS